MSIIVHEVLFERVCDWVDDTCSKRAILSAILWINEVTWIKIEWELNPLGKDLKIVL